MSEFDAGLLTEAAAQEILDAIRPRLREMERQNDRLIGELAHLRRAYDRIVAELAEAKRPAPRSARAKVRPHIIQLELDENELAL